MQNEFDERRGIPDEMQQLVFRINKNDFKSKKMAFTKNN